MVLSASLLAAALACNLGSVDAAITPSATAQATERATRTPGERANRPAGTYFCFGHEGGQLAAAGTLTLRADGSAVDTPAPGLGGEPRTGTWQYDPAAGQLRFSEDLGYARAEYSTSSGRISIELAPTVERPHAEEGRLSCEPR
jgi:hypothetical protein